MGDSSSERPNTDEGSIPQKKKIKSAKRKCVFNVRWMKEKRFSNWLRKGDNEHCAKCIICFTQFHIDNLGLSAITKHESTKKHVTATRAFKTDALVTNIEDSSVAKDDLEVTAAELAFIYHSLCHDHTFPSMCCSLKLMPKLFHHSTTCKKLRCARTKCTAIVEKVLAPKSVELQLREMENGQKFSVSTTEAFSNFKGTVKLCPIVIQYFSKKYGTKRFVLDFYENFNDDSNAVYEKILEILRKNGLEVKNMIAFGVDEKYESIYNKLNSINNRLIRTNCSCRVVHNAAKYGINLLPFDVESLVHKIYLESSSSRFTEVVELKECFEFANRDYFEVLGHSTLRWLSLAKAVDRVVKNWRAIKVYFLSQGKEECCPLVWKFVRDQEYEINDDKDLSISECFLYFVQHYINIFVTAIKSLESDSVYSPNLFPILDSLRDSLVYRIKDKWFGSYVNQAVSKLSSSDRALFENSCLNAYKRSLERLEKGFDFNDSIFKTFAPLTLDSPLSFDSITATIPFLNLSFSSSEMDELYEEYGNLDKILSKIDPNKNLSTEQRWKMFFDTTKSPLLFKIVAAVLSLPTSNTFIDKLLDMMKNLCTDERNKLRPVRVKAELCTRVNYNMSCQSFHDFVSRDKDLLLFAKSQDKYDF